MVDSWAAPVLRRAARRVGRRNARCRREVDFSPTKALGSPAPCVVVRRRRGGRSRRRDPATGGRAVRPQLAREAWSTGAESPRRVDSVALTPPPDPSSSPVYFLSVADIQHQDFASPLKAEQHAIITRSQPEHASARSTLYFYHTGWMRVVRQPVNFRLDLPPHSAGVDAPSAPSRCGSVVQQVRRWLERRWQTRRPPAC